ncbi:MAG: hypothetical protein AB8C13_10200 [Phycisphaerales bacterium]
MNHTHDQSRRGITLAETVISMLIVVFVIVSTLQLVAPLSRSTTVHADRLVAANLATQLSEEIATKYFMDPVPDSEDLIGFESDDATTRRDTFDDIDDYHGWSSSPPELSSGTSLITLIGWTRTVKVSHAPIASPFTESPTNTGLKLVVVTVLKDGVELAKISTLHSQTADDLEFIVSAP